MRDGREVANYILDYADDKGIGITNLSLQKIVYFCHAWYLASTGEPLIKHDFEAWEFGPVLPYLYREFKCFEDRKITTRAYKLDPAVGNRVVARLDLEKGKEIILESIVSFFSSLTASQLVDQSHIDGGPWCKAWNYRGRVNPGMKISNEDIRKFYASQERFYTFQ